MTVNPSTLRSESFAEMGLVLRRDAPAILEAWCLRAAEEQPQAQRVHQQALLDHLPRFLDELGNSLSAAGDNGAAHHFRPALQHGHQRWTDGWSLTEVVRDYQILRLVLVDYLEAKLHRPLGSREHQALSLALDEAIGVSVGAYVDHYAEHSKSQEKERADRAQETADFLRRHAEHLQEAHRNKDEFMALMSHELRNPLAPIRNALHVLTLDSTPETLAWARGLMERQLGVLTRLVDDLLDVSRIARDKIALVRERLDLASLVRNAVEDRRGSFVEAGLDLQVQTPSEPVWVSGEATRLTQVLGNILHNALKFTNRGGRVRVVLGVNAGAEAEMTISDTGVGIAAHLLPRVFEAYMQADSQPERRTGGLGLGLALVKGLVELHGGRVAASSEGTGRGTQFKITLPLVP
jgi:signal transduction histidine kinase